ncbi:hypothetical protein [Nocardia testacea]|uniref:hypothetical protein n=1 Tax=Nocardia testacea TaxID=248551 RepID=UPI0033C52D0E
MTLLHPFRSRRAPHADMAAMRVQIDQQGKKIRDLNAIVDDIIDAWASVQTRATGDTGTPGYLAALTATGPVHGQHITFTFWSCHNPGHGITTDQAKQITREHLDCPGNDPTVCRIKHAAMRHLAATGVLVPGSRISIASR